MWKWFHNLCNRSSQSSDFYWNSSLHCNFSLSFCSFSYNGVHFDGLKLSVNDVIVSQKESNGNGKLQFFGRDYNFTHPHCAKIHLWAKIYVYRCLVTGLAALKAPLVFKTVWFSKLSVFSSAILKLKVFSNSSAFLRDFSLW